jgi:hypothetical protein
MTLRRRTGIELLLTAFPDLLLGVPEVLARQLVPVERLVVLAHRLPNLGRRLTSRRLTVRQTVAGFGRGGQEVSDRPDRQLDAVEAGLDFRDARGMTHWRQVSPRCGFSKQRRTHVESSGAWLRDRVAK